MSIKLERIIHPVGQGAFYTERFSDEKGNCIFNVVYDCGSDTENGEYLKKEISDYYKDYKNIEFLFISHFHEDHCNGLQELFQHANVKNLVLPIITDEMKYITFANIINSEKKDNSQKISWIGLLQKPEETILNWVNDKNKVVPNIIWVDHSEEINDIDDPISNIGLSKIKSGSKFTLKSSREFWEYRFYNLIPEKVKEEAKKICEEFFKDKPFATDKYEYVRSFADELSKKIKRNKWNEYSLIVLSKPVVGISSKLKDDNVEIAKRLNVLGRGGFTPNPYLNSLSTNEDKEAYLNKSACLYTGDFNLKNNYEEVKKILSNRINVFQIPHHGSKENFNAKILDDKNFDATTCLFFLSAGINNKYNHPHFSMLYNFIKKEIAIVIVTEDNDNELTLDYTIEL